MDAPKNWNPDRKRRVSPPPLALEAQPVALADGEHIATRLRSQFGMPPNAALWRLVITSPYPNSRFHLYFVLAYGVQVPWDEPPNVIPPWPNARFYEAGEPVDTWQLWWQQAQQRERSAIIAESTWHPFGGERRRVLNLPAPTTREHLEEALIGFELIDHVREQIAGGGGRPNLSGHWRTPEAFRAEVDPLLRQLRAEGKAEGKQQVAEYMPATGWRQHDRPVTLQARVRRLERATKNLLHMTWDEYVRTVD
jgi:hypothetical protein